jgi:hypothetical protein
VGNAGLIGKCKAVGFQHLQQFDSAVNGQPAFLAANAVMIDV